jgi:hypothetical protein
VTVAEALRLAEQRLGEAGVDTPRVDAELLLAHVLGVSRTGVHERRSQEVPDEFDSLLERRSQREPLAYVLGEWGFRRLVLTTDARALVPRPETEVVVERCLALLRDEPEPRVLDLGTGSGAIALAIADERPDARVTAVDFASAPVELERATWRPRPRAGTSSSRIRRTSRPTNGTRCSRRSGTGSRKTRSSAKGSTRRSRGSQTRDCSCSRSETGRRTTSPTPWRHSAMRTSRLLLTWPRRTVWSRGDVDFRR